MKSTICFLSLLCFILFMQDKSNNFGVVDAFTARETSVVVMRGNSVNRNSFIPSSSTTLCYQQRQQFLSPSKLPKQTNKQLFPQTPLPSSALSLSSSDSNEKNRDFRFLFDIGTKGGAVFLSFVLLGLPFLAYLVVTAGFGVDGLEAGKWIGVGFTVIVTLLWVGTYIFRVATKDMTYAKQLKDYENAVIAKRLEELDEDELQALVEEVERDEF